MITTNKNLFEMMKEFIIETMQKNSQRLDIYVVESVNEEEFMVNIKHPSFKNLEFNNVPISSAGLGNFKGGVMKLPSQNDYVLVAFIGENLEEPIVLNTLFNNNDNGRQAIPQIKQDELFLNNKSKGSYIIINNENDIKIKSCDSSGNQKGLITIDSDGIITLNEGTMSVARVGDDVSVVGSTEPAGTGPHTHDINITATISTGNDTVKG